MSGSFAKVVASKFTGSGADRKIVLGFQPKKVEIYNVTDFISYNKTELMATNKSIKTAAAGTQTYPASVVIESDGFTLIAAENVADKEFHYAAYESKVE